MTKVLLVGYDHTDGTDNSVLIVGVRNAAKGTDIINSFSGEEAEELFKRLTTKSEK